MGTAREVELKLRVSADRLHEVSSSPHLNADGAPLLTSRAHKDTYYDTPGLTLHERGFVLRIRETDGLFVQTVKSRSDGASGLFRRGEWEQNVVDAKPDLARIDDAVMREQLGGVTTMLAPIFTSEVHRRTSTVKLGNAARIEVAIDQGQITTPKGSAPVCEIELELQEGEPDAVYDLALELNEVAPAHLETMSKSDRGYAILAEKATVSSKAPSLVLDPGMTGLEAFQAIQRHHLMHLLANETAACEGSDPEGVHQVRVALRRLRSVLTLFGSVLPADWMMRLSEELRWLQREMNPARDLDVFLMDLLRPVREAMPEETDLDALQSYAEAARLPAYERVRTALATTRYTALLLEVSRIVETHGWLGGLDAETQGRLAAPARDLASGFLSERHRKAKDRGRGFAKLSIDDRHRFRLALKKLRYAADSLRSLYVSEGTAKYMKRLARLQDLLGHLNDVVIMRRMRDEFARGADPTTIARANGLVIGWHGRGIAVIEPKLRKQQKAFKAAQPFWREGVR